VGAEDSSSALFKGGWGFTETCAGVADGLTAMSLLKNVATKS